MLSGSFHYFRALPDTWRSKLKTLKASGLNTVTTYIEWSLHNPKDGIYLWDGIADFELFLRIAADEGLLVVLRPGPYICAERDMVCICRGDFFVIFLVNIDQFSTIFSILCVFNF